MFWRSLISYKYKKNIFFHFIWKFIQVGLQHKRALLFDGRNTIRLCSIRIDWPYISLRCVSHLVCNVSSIKFVESVVAASVSERCASTLYTKIRYISCDSRQTQKIIAVLHAIWNFNLKLNSNKVRFLQKERIHCIRHAWASAWPNEVNIWDQ